jgi:hypothetical protein
MATTAVLGLARNDIAVFIGSILTTETGSIYKNIDNTPLKLH